MALVTFFKRYSGSRYRPVEVDEEVFGGADQASIT